MKRNPNTPPVSATQAAEVGGPARDVALAQAMPRSRGRRKRADRGPDVEAKPVQTTTAALDEQDPEKLMASFDHVSGEGLSQAPQIEITDTAVPTVQIAMAEPMRLEGGQTQTSATPSLLPPWLATVWPPSQLSLTIGSWLLAVLAIRNGSDNPAPGNPDSNQNLATVQGAITLGPALRGHTLTVSAYDASGQLLAQAPLNADGSYTLTVTNGYTGPVLLRVTDSGDGPDYFDEATGTERDLDGELRSVAVLDASGSATAHVTPLTELVLRMLGLPAGQSGAGGITLGNISAEQITAVKTKLAQALGLDGIDLTTARPTPIIDAAGKIDLSRANAYGRLLAALSGMEAGEGHSTDQMLQALLASIDLQTGTLSPDGLMDLVSGARLVAKKHPAADALFSGVGQAMGLSPAQINGIDSAWSTLLSLADGQDNDGAGLSALQLQALGVQRISQGPRLDALNNVLDVKTAAAVQSRTKLQAWADTVAVVLSTAAGDAAAPTQAELEELGLTDLTPGRTSDLVNKIAASPDDGSAVDTLGKLQALIDTTPPTTTLSNLVLAQRSGTSEPPLTNVARQDVNARLSAPLAPDERLLGSIDGGITWNDISRWVSGIEVSLTPTLNELGRILLKVQDAAGNDGPVFEQRYVLDTQGPALTVTQSDKQIAGDGIINATERTAGVLLSGTTEPGASVGIDTGKGAILPTPVDNTGTWSVTVPANWLPTEGTMTFTVESRDPAGNMAAATRSVSVDTAAPTLGTAAPGVSLSTVAGTSGNSPGEAITLTLTFSEPVNGLTGGSDSTVFTAGGAGVPAQWSGSQDSNTRTLTYTVQAGQNGQAAIDEAALKAALVAGISDGAGNDFAYSGQMANIDNPVLPVIDTTAPTATIASDTSALRAGETATITITFSEDPSSTFTNADIAVNGGMLSAISGAGLTRTATFTPTANLASGSASITVAAHSYTDAAGNSGGASSMPSIGLDTLAPTLAITSDKSALRAGETAAITFTFSEDPGSTFSNADIAVSGGMLSAISGTGLTRTATFTPTANLAIGSASITVAAHSYTDAAGNSGKASSMPSVGFDTLTPTASIRSDKARLKVGETASLTLAFSEAVAGLSKDDLSVESGTLGALSAGTVNPDGSVSYTIAYTPAVGTEDPAMVVSLANTWTDTLGNSGTNAKANVAVDTQAPTLSHQMPQDAATEVGASGNLVLTFSERVQSQGTGNILIKRMSDDSTAATLNAKDASITGSGASTQASIYYSGLQGGTPYYVIVTPSAFADDAGNPYEGLSNQATAGWNFTTADPSLGINAVATDNWVNATENSQTIELSGAITGTNAAIVGAYTALTATLAPSGGGNAVTANNVTYTAGAWTAEVPANALADGKVYVLTVNAAGGPGPALTTTATVRVDTQAPTVLTFSADNTDGTASDADQTVTYSATFAEAIRDLNEADLSISGGTLVNGSIVLAFDSRSVFFQVKAADDSTANLVVNLKNTLGDAAGNPLVVPSPVSLPVDTRNPTLSSTTAPGVALSTVAGTAGNSAGETITLTLTFDGPVNGLTSGNNNQVFTIGGAGVNASWSGSANTRTLTYTVQVGQNGQVALDEAALKAALRAGLSDPAGNAFAYTDNIPDIDSSPLPLIDTTAPTLAITSDQSALKAGETATVTFTFSEDPGSTFSNADIAVGGGMLSSISGAGLTRTATFTPTANLASGSASITVAAQSYTDAAGNSGEASSMPSVGLDTLAPTLAITSDKSTLRAGETATITFTFSEDPETSFAWDGGMGDVDVSGGTLSAISGTGLTRTATFTPTPDLASGSAIITVAAHSYTDAAGNSGRASSMPSISMDTRVPSLKIETIAKDDTITALEAAQGLTVTGHTSAEDGQQVQVYWFEGSLTTGEVSQGRWSVSLSYDDLPEDGEHLLTARIVDANGNPFLLNTRWVTVDVAPPTVTVSSITLTQFSEATDPPLTQTVEQEITATLSAPLALGERLLLSLDNGEQWLDISASASGTSVTHAVKLDELGIISLKVQDAVGQDGAVADQAYLLDTVAPTLTIDRVATDNIIDAEEKAIGLTLSGTTDTEDGQIVTVSWGDLIWDPTAIVGTWDATVIAGQWSVTIEPDDIPAAGSYLVAAVVTDQAGNLTAANDQTVTVAPDEPDPIILELEFEPITGDDWINALEAASELTISGTTNANDGQQVQLHWSSIGEPHWTSASFVGLVSGGRWSATTTLPEDIPNDGEYRLTASILDNQDNPIVLNTHPVTVDTQAPSALLQIEPTQTLGQPTADHTSQRMLPLPDGGFLLSWVAEVPAEPLSEPPVSEFRIRLQRFDIPSEPVGDFYEVTEPVVAYENPQILSLGSSGDFVVCWVGENFIPGQGQDEAPPVVQQVIFYQRFNASARPLDALPIRIDASFGEDFDELALTALGEDGMWAVAWYMYASTELFVQRIGPIPAPDGEELGYGPLDDPLVIQVPGTVELLDLQWLTLPPVNQDPEDPSDKQFVLVWEADTTDFPNGESTDIWTDIFWQRFDGDGQAIDAEGQAIDPQPVRLPRPLEEQGDEPDDLEDVEALALGPGGNFVLVYEADDNESSINRIFVSHITREGEVTDTQAVETPDGQHMYARSPEAIALSDNRFVMTWVQGENWWDRQAWVQLFTVDDQGDVTSAPAYRLPAPTDESTVDDLQVMAWHDGFLVSLIVEDGLSGEYDETSEFYVTVQAFDALGHPVDGPHHITGGATSSAWWLDTATLPDGSQILSWINTLEPHNTIGEEPLDETVNFWHLPTDLSFTSGVTFSTDAAEDEDLITWLGVGDTVYVTLKFNDAVIVHGHPALQLFVGSDEVLADYYGPGESDDELVFSYTIEAGDADPDGIMLGELILAAGASLTDEAGNNAVLPNTGELLINSGYRVDTQAPIAWAGLQEPVMVQSWEIWPEMGLISVGAAKILASLGDSANPANPGDLLLMSLVVDTPVGPLAAFAVVLPDGTVFPVFDPEDPEDLQYLYILGPSPDSWIVEMMMGYDAWLDTVLLIPHLAAARVVQDSEGSAIVLSLSPQFEPIEIAFMPGDEGDFFAPQIELLGTSGAMVMTWAAVKPNGMSEVFVLPFHAGDLLDPDWLPGPLSAEGPSPTGIPTNSWPGDLSVNLVRVTALGEQGAFVVACVGADDDNDALAPDNISPDDSIYLQVFAPGGIALGLPLQIEAPDVTNGTDGAPQVLALGEDSFVLAWMGENDSGDMHWFVQRFAVDISSDNFFESTVTPDDAIELSPAVPSTQWDPEQPRQWASVPAQLTALGNGNFVISWVGQGQYGNPGVFVQRFAAGQSGPGEAVQLASVGVGDEPPRVAALGTDGAFAVAWRDWDSGIYVQRFGANGEMAGPADRLELPDDMDMDILVSNVQIAAVGDDGSYAVTWTARQWWNGQWGPSVVFVQHFNPDGSTSRDVTVEVGDDVRVSSSEPGTAYLVNTGEVPDDLADIEALDGQFWNSVGIYAGYSTTDLSTEGLALGEYKLYTRDESGLWSAGSEHIITVVDTITPSLPTLTSPTHTNAATPLLEGTAEPGSSIVLTVEGATFSTITDMNGIWQVDTATAPSTGTFNLGEDGSKDVEITSTDAAGNSSNSSTSFTLDTLEPEALLRLAPHVTLEVPVEGYAMPQILGLPEDEFLVYWVGDAGRTIYTQRFDDTGPLANPVPFATADPDLQGTIESLSAVPLGGGMGWAMSWSLYLEGNSDTRTYVQVIANNGQAENPLLLEFDETRYASDSQMAAVGSNGEFVVVWDALFEPEGQGGFGSWKSYLQRFSRDSNGQAIAEPPIVLPEHPQATGTQDQPQVAALGSEGEFVVVWKAGDQTNDFSLIAQRFGQDGQASGEPLFIEPDPVIYLDEDGHRIAALGTEGAFVLVYESYDMEGDVPSQSFMTYVNSNGDISDALPLLAPGMAGVNAQSPVVSALSNDSFVVAWVLGEYEEEAQHVCVQRFGVDLERGDIVAGPVQKLPALSAYSEVWDLQVLPWGEGFAMSWTSWDGEADRVMVQLFDDAGLPVGGAQQLRDSEAQHAYSPQMAALTGGDLVLSWVSSFDQGDDVEENDVKKVSVQRLESEHPFGDGVSFSSSADEGLVRASWLRQGDTMNIVLSFNEEVEVTGIPRLSLQLGDADVWASYVSGQGTADLVFRYTVQAGQADPDGIMLGELDLSNGAITDAAGNAALLPNTGALQINSGYRVDTQAPIADAGLGMPLELVESGWFEEEGALSTTLLHLLGSEDGKRFQALTANYAPDLFLGFQGLLTQQDFLDMRRLGDEGSGLGLLDFFSSQMSLVFGLGSDAAGLPDGGAISAWQSPDNFNEYGQSDGDLSIYYQFSNFGGFESAPLEGVSTSVPVQDGDDIFPKVAALNSGAVITWIGETAPDVQSVFVQSILTDGDLGPLHGFPMAMRQTDFMIFGEDAVYSPAQVAAIGSGDRFVVAWSSADSADSESDDSIFVARFDANGNPELLSGQPDVVQLEPLNVTDGHDLMPQVVAVGTAGAFAVVWCGQDDEENYKVFVQLFDDSGAPSGSPIELEEPVSLGLFSEGFVPQAISLGTSGFFAVAWCGSVGGETKVFVHRLGQQGLAQEAAVMLEDPLRDDAINIFPQMVALGNGGEFAVTWQSVWDPSPGHFGDEQSSALVQGFDASGNPVGDPWALQSPQGDGQANAPRIAALGTSGDFVVGWTDSQQNGFGPPVARAFVQRFNADGSKGADQTVFSGDDVRVGSSEPGMAYLVNENEVIESVSDILQLLAGSSDSCKASPIYRADTPTALSTTGLAAGNYRLYTVDAAGYLSAPSDKVIVVRPAPLHLGEVGINVDGFVVSGEQEDDNSGSKVSAAGDVNGDGLSDLLIAASGANDSGGRSYVVFGKTDSQAVALSALGSRGFIIDGNSGGWWGDYRVAGVGDVNGDGLDDLIIGSASGSTDAGQSYVVFGKTDSSSVSLSTLTGSAGFVLAGTSGSAPRVSAAGDVNGDGLADLLVGFPDELNDAGRSYVVFGKSDSAPVNFTNLGGIGFAINGETSGDRSGGQVSPAGDFNGDGLSDLLIAASGANNWAGKAYVVFGKTDSDPIHLASEGSGSLAILGQGGVATEDLTVAAAGDVNGDGLADVIIGAPSDRTSSPGRSYVVFGRTDTSTPIHLSNLGIGGFAIESLVPGDMSGWSVATAGDLNGDGLSDLLVGAPGVGYTNEYRGHTYVIFGRTNSTTVQLSDIAAGSGGFVIAGQSNGDQSGSSVSAAGDVDGDGLADLIVGAPDAGLEAGKSYVIFGSAVKQLYDTAVDELGGSVDDAFSDGDIAKTLVGGAGNDTLTATAASVLYGGAGDDRFEIEQAMIAALQSPTGSEMDRLARIDGGSGIDTLALSGSALVLDLTQVANPAAGAPQGGSRLNSIEIIDLTGTGDNTLRLRAADVLDLGGFNAFEDTGRRQLMVRGDADDPGDSDPLGYLVELIDSGWSENGSANIDSIGYTRWEHNASLATLYLALGVVFSQWLVSDSHQFEWA